MDTPTLGSPEAGAASTPVDTPADEVGPERDLVEDVDGGEDTADDDGGSRHLITIVSPKGGAGKTTVATNLAVGLAKRHPKQVVLVDLDLQFGDVASCLKQQPTSTVYDLASKWPTDSAQLKLALTAHSSGLFTLCAPNNPAEADEVGVPQVTGILRSLAKSFRFVIVDTNPGLTEHVLASIDVSTDCVLVCATEVPSIRGLRKALDALDTIGMTAARRVFLLNRANAKTGLDPAHVEKTVGQRVDVRLPSTLDLVLSVNDGIPIMQSGRNSTVVGVFEELCDLFEPDKPDAADKGGGLRLFKRRT